MATLQKFKHLATQCAVAGSPTGSPSASPVIHLRRRKTLRMLLSRTGGGTSSSCGARRLPRSKESPDRKRTTADDSPQKRKELVVSHKLKDLLVSSPPLEERHSDKVRDAGARMLTATSVPGGVAVGRRGGQRSLRPLSATFRQRLLRRPWRPVLVTIPE